MKRIEKLNNYSLILEFIDNAKKILTDKDIPLDDERFLKLKELTKSNPSYIGLLTHYVFNGGDKMDQIEKLMDLVKKYSQLLRNEKINPLELIKYGDYKKVSSFHEKPKGLKSGDKIYRYYFLEELTDTINGVVVDNDKKKFVKKFVSNKYKHLINDKTTELFYVLKQMGEKLGWKNTHEKIQLLLTEVMIVFKTPEEFNNALEKTIEQISGGWNTKAISENVESEGAKVVYSDDRFVICDILEDKDILDVLGSPKWCIVYSQGEFDNYVKFPNKQYIMYDTNFDRTDKLSMIGVTIEVNGKELGKYRTAHDREDRYFSENKLKELGVREHFKPMGIEQIKENPDKLTTGQKLRYGMEDLVIRDIESGSPTSDPIIDIDNDRVKKNLVTLSVKYNINMLKYLDENYDIEFVGGHVQTATQFGNVETLEYMYDKGSQLNVFNGTPLLSAVSNGHINVVKFLLENGVDVNVGMFNPLQIPCERADGLEMVKLLVSHGVNITRDNNKAIKIAGGYGNGDIVKFLLEQPGVKDSLTEGDIRWNKLGKWL